MANCANLPVHVESRIRLTTEFGGKRISQEVKSGAFGEDPDKSGTPPESDVNINIVI